MPPFCRADIECDDHHQWKDTKKVCYPVVETAAKQERIFKEVSRLFRERGFENVRVGEVRKPAGLTHGAYYAQFGSENELLAPAVSDEILRSVRPKPG